MTDNETYGHTWRSLDLTNPQILTSCSIFGAVWMHLILGTYASCRHSFVPSVSLDGSIVAECLSTFAVWSKQNFKLFNIHLTVFT